MRKLTTLLLPFAVLWPTFSADLHAGGFGHGNFGRGFGGYGYNGFGRSYYGGFGYGYRYGTGYPYSCAYSYPLAFQVVPYVQQQYVYVQPVPVQVQTFQAAYAAPVQVPTVQPLPAYEPAPVQAYQAATPVYVAPTPAVCAQEVQQGYLTAGTVGYLATLDPYARFAFLHRHYGATFRDRFFTHHFGAIPAGFRRRLGPPRVERIGPPRALPRAQPERNRR